MLTLAQDKTLDALEYALRIIEEYDREFQKRTSKKDKDSKRKEDQGKELVHRSRFNDVKNNYLELINLQRERAVDYVSNSGVYKFADEKLHLHEKFERSREFTSNLYNSLSTKVIVPVQDKIVLIYDTSLQKASLVIENLKDAHIAQKFCERFHNAKVVLSKDWMKLDLNNDGKVSISDLILAIKNLRIILMQLEVTGKAYELGESVKRKAISYLACSKDSKANSNEEVPLVKIDGNDSNSSDSIEMKDFNDKDD